MKINFYKVYNDFGATLPDKSSFFNDQRNEVTRVMLCHYYGNKGATDLRRFKWFCEEYKEFVSGLKKETKQKEVKDAAE